MGWVLRKPADRTNPVLPGGVYGWYITAGRGVYWRFTGSRVAFVLILSDGGVYGMCTPTVVEYKGVPLNPAEYKVHPGAYTKQVTAQTATSVSAGSDTVTKAGHGLVNGDGVRFLGTLPGGINDGKLFVVGATSSTFQVSLTSGGAVIDITSAPATTIFYKANAGWDDPDQGLPQFCPETNTTFSGIFYIEGLIPEAYIQNEEPDWAEFRIVGVGRKLMDYDNTGAELGVTSDPALCTNNALADVDDIQHEMRIAGSRIDWASWKLFRDDCNADQTITPDLTEQGTGWLAKYYTYPGPTEPANIAAGTERLQRLDHAIDFSWYTNGPGGGIAADYFMVMWQAQLKPDYTETYTFTVTHDDGVRLYVNNVLIIDQWVSGAASTHTGTAALTANQLVTVKLEFYQLTGPASVTLKWKSTSQADQVIPMTAAYEADQSIKRYEMNGAYAIPTEASVVHEDIMKRAPGWDWTDVDGKITYLAPTRTTKFTFIYDWLDDDIDSTIIEKSFQKTRKNRRDRVNFKLYSYRDRAYTGFPEHFVEQNRPRLRQLSGGMPNNDEPEMLMVMSRSLAVRMSNMDMKLGSDSAYDLSLEGRRPSGAVTKGHLVIVKNLVEDDRQVENSTCLVKRVRKTGKTIQFDLTPVAVPYYSENIVTGGRVAV